ncbi:MAG: YHS domain-containing (seleno)protein [Vibrio sp.]
MTRYWKYLTLIFLFASQAFFSSQALAKSDPIYTGTFSNKAVDGYDTVAYFTEGKPVEGKKEFTTSYKGADWLFASQEHLDMFKADPEKYAPQYGGYCAWAVAAKNELYSGDPERWAVYNDKLYLNYDKSVQDMWVKDKDGFIATANKNWPAILDK